MTEQEMESQIAIADEAIKNASASRRHFENELRRLRARKYIEATKMTLADVQLSSGDDIPWHGHISGFIDWMKSRPLKPYVEWNGQVYQSIDFLNGKMVETGVRISDLK